MVSDQPMSKINDNQSTSDRNVYLDCKIYDKNEMMEKCLDSEQDLFASRSSCDDYTDDDKENGKACEKPFKNHSKKEARTDEQKNGNSNVVNDLNKNRHNLAGCSKSESFEESDDWHSVISERYYDCIDSDIQMCNKRKCNDERPSKICKSNGPSPQIRALITSSENIYKNEQMFELQPVRNDYKKESVLIRPISEQKHTQTIELQIPILLIIISHVTL